ncbi:MAG: hypothetical protein AB1696_15170 [Planctomycetota bacterium]
MSGCLAQVTVAPPGSVDQERIKKIAVLDFEWKPDDYMAKATKENRAIELTGGSDLIPNRLAEFLASTGRYTVVGRGEVYKRLAKHNLSQTGRFDGSDVGAFGTVLEVDAVVVGRATKFHTSGWMPWNQSVVAFESRCVDVKTGEVLWTLGGERDHIGNNPSVHALQIIRDGVRQLKDKLRAGRYGKPRGKGTL